MSNFLFRVSLNESEIFFFVYYLFTLGINFQIINQSGGDRIFSETLQNHLLGFQFAHRVRGKSLRPLRLSSSALTAIKQFEQNAVTLAVLIPHRVARRGGAKSNLKEFSFDPIAIPDLQGPSLSRDRGRSERFVQIGSNVSARTSGLCPMPAAWANSHLAEPGLGTSTRDNFTRVGTSLRRRRDPPPVRIKHVSATP